MKTFIIITIALGIMTGLLSIAFKRIRGSRALVKEARMLELLMEARKLFPAAENDIERLDLLWQWNYRNVIRKRNDGENVESDLSDSILLWNERMRLINEDVQQEIDMFTRAN